MRKETSAGNNAMLFVGSASICVGVGWVGWAAARAEWELEGNKLCASTLPMWGRVRARGAGEVRVGGGWGMIETGRDRPLLALSSSPRALFHVPRSLFWEMSIDTYCKISSEILDMDMILMIVCRCLEC